MAFIKVVLQRDFKPICKATKQVSPRGVFFPRWDCEVGKRMASSIMAAIDD